MFVPAFIISHVSSHDTGTTESNCYCVVINIVLGLLSPRELESFSRRAQIKCCTQDKKKHRLLFVDHSSAVVSQCSQFVLER